MNADSTKLSVIAKILMNNLIFESIPQSVIKVQKKADLAKASFNK